MRWHALAKALVKVAVNPAHGEPRHNKITLEYVVLVEDLPSVAASTPDNVIPIVPWLGDANDTGMRDLRGLLEGLVDVRDVRPCLRRLFGLRRRAAALVGDGCACTTTMPDATCSCAHALEHGLLLNARAHLAAAASQEEEEIDLWGMGFEDAPSTSTSHGEKQSPTKRKVAAEPRRGDKHQRVDVD